jgi:hypothetical protein
MSVASCHQPTQSDTSPSTNTTYSVGDGYNVFGEYANMSALMAPVLDYQKMASAGVVNVSYPDTTTSITVAGNSEATYSNSYSIDLGVSGSYESFSGSFSSHFASTSSSKDTYAYTTIQSKVRKVSVQISPAFSTNPVSLRPYLTPAAQAAIDGADATYTQPNALFAAYGTHVLAWGYYGGRLDYNSLTDSTEYTGSTSVGVEAQFGFDNGISSADASTNVQVKNDYSSFQAHTNTSLFLVGGNSVAGLQGQLSAAGYSAWASDFDNPANQVLCDFDTNNGSICLVPIWELCDTSSAAGKARQTALENAFNAYAQSQSSANSSTLTVKLYHIYEMYGYPNQNYTWTYAYNLQGLNTTGVLLQNADSFSTGWNQFIDFKSDGTWTIDATDSGTWGQYTINVPKAANLAAVVIPVSIGSMSSASTALYALNYNSATDTFTLNSSSISSPYYFGKDNGITSSPGCPAQADTAAFKLTRGGAEQIVDFAVGAPGDTKNYLFTKIGFIWN